MSSAVVSTSAALGRPFVFDEEAVPGVSVPELTEPRPPQPERRSGLTSSDPRLAHVTPASRLDARPAPEMVSSGIPALDALTGGLPRGCLTEIYGTASSGRTTLLLAALAAATRRGEFCAVVDASDALDPQSATAAGVELERMLWVRCSEDLPQSEISPRRNRNTEKQTNQKKNTYPAEHRLEQVLRATDLLLESGGFGLIVLDLGDLPPQSARRIPLTTWFRFRRAVEHKPTILLAIEQQPIAGSCSSLLLQLASQNNPEEANRWGSSESSREANFSHTQLLTSLPVNAEICSRLQRKPAHSITFGTKTAWAG